MARIVAGGLLFGPNRHRAYLAGPPSAHAAGAVVTLLDGRGERLAVYAEDVGWREPLAHALVAAATYS